jgi:hypothetical protein
MPAAERLAGDGLKYNRFHNWRPYHDQMVAKQDGPLPRPNR